MIDLHCHILPGVDDGPQSLDETLEMARFYVDDGIYHVVATPHCHRYIHLLREEILPHVARLNETLQREGLDLTIYPGSEIQVTDPVIYKREFQEHLYCHLGDGDAFTLLEFNWARDLFPADAPKLIQWIRTQGMTPILAHPERHDYFGKEPALLADMIGAGAWCQITVDSLLGNHGHVPKEMGAELLKTYPDCILATDAHNMARCSGLTAGYAWAEHFLGAERADDLRRRAETILAASVGKAV